MSPDGPLRVVLADRDHFSRDGLRGMFEADGATVVGEASSSSEAVSMLASAKADVIVIDPNEPGTEPADTLAALVAAAPETRVAVLTDTASAREVMVALSAGAGSYLTKDEPAEALVSAIRQTAAGHTVLAAAATRGLLSQLSTPPLPAEVEAATPPPIATLSGRESEVLRMIVAGADNAEIGKALSISRHTAKQHVTNIFDKLGVRSRVEAAVLAVREKLV
jgi:DNA-binding NarL/FixJ family response regulator